MFSVVPDDDSGQRERNFRTATVPDGSSGQRKRDFRTAVEDAKAIATGFAMEAEVVLGRRTARFLGVLAFFAIVVGVLLALLHWYIGPTGAEQRQSLIVTLAQILGGAALLSGLYFTWRTLQVNREGQITERFTRAIDQLGAIEDDGNPRLEIRLGGIYALERIANDSPDRDYSTIMEVLTTYVRENTPRPLEAISPPASEPSETNAATEPSNRELPKPRADIQAILTVLGRRKKAGEEGDVVLNISSTDLRGAALEGAHLQGVNLQRADLDGARLDGARLDRANLRGAILTGVRLKGAHLVGTDLRPYVTWGDADITIYEVRNLTIAEASEGGPTQKQLDEALGDENTKLPPGLKPPAHWGVKTDEQAEED